MSWSVGGAVKGWVEMYNTSLQTCAFVPLTHAHDDDSLSRPLTLKPISHRLSKIKTNTRIIHA